MSVFYTFLIKISPVYLFILLGYIATKRLGVQKEGLSKLLLYIVSPAVIFYGTYKANLSAANLALPLFFYLISATAAGIFYFIGKRFWQDDPSKNILSYTSGTGNTGFFGLPAVLLLFDEKVFSIAVLALFGFSLYENTIGFFITARGNFTIRESLKKVVSLPTIYTFALGILFNKLEIVITAPYLEALSYFKGAYSLFGMMIIGMGIATVSLRNIDWLFVGLAFSARFIFWPLVVLTVVGVDKSFLQFFSDDAHKLMVLFSCVPLAASTVYVSTELNARPEKAVVAVFLSTIFALFFIPLVFLIFL